MKQCLTQQLVARLQTSQQKLIDLLEKLKAGDESVRSEIDQLQQRIREDLRRLAEARARLDKEVGQEFLNLDAFQAMEAKLQAGEFTLDDFLNQVRMIQQMGSLKDLVEKIQKENWTEFDSMVATPDMMGLVGRLGRVLGPKGLMPNPKVGTVTNDVAKAVRELKAGRVEFRVEKAGVVQARIGKASFGGDKLRDNARTMIETLLRLKPQSAKGTYMRSVTVSTTMGPGIKVDHLPLVAEFETK